MKILCLYNNECAVELFECLEKMGHETILCSEKLDAEECKSAGYDLTVSYTYRYILTNEIISALNGNVVNIHNSYLPFNRGADPNMWSWIDRTPRGVSLHYMDAELDKGYLIAQMIVNDTDEETLRSSYDNLDKAAKKMFIEAFAKYDKWPEMKRKAEGNGSYHSVKDGLKYKECIESYDITVRDFLDKIKDL